MSGVHLCPSPRFCLLTSRAKEHDSLLGDAHSRSINFQITILRSQSSAPDGDGLGRHRLTGVDVVRVEDGAEAALAEHGVGVDLVAVDQHRWLLGGRLLRRGFGCRGFCW